jgi:hypothetical protein
LRAYINRWIDLQLFGHTLCNKSQQPGKIGGYRRRQQTISKIHVKIDFDVRSNVCKMIDYTRKSGLKIFVKKTIIVIKTVVDLLIYFLNCFTLQSLTKRISMRFTKM